MIYLRKMKQEEFTGYLDYFIKDYAAEIEKNYKYPKEKANQQAIEEIQRDLPQGALTPDQCLLCIEQSASESTSESEKELIGYLWYKNRDEGKTAFIADFYIFSERQGKGLAQASLKAFEEKLLLEGIEEIKLRVAYENHRAKKLYERMDFSITGINMAKRLKE